MQPLELKELVAAGESSSVEFKRKATTPDKLAKEISALANTRGGILLIGVDDDGTIVGVKSEKSEIDMVEIACQFHIKPPIQPEIEIMNYKGLDVILIYIDESRVKPHIVEIGNGNGDKPHKRAYIRLGEKSVIASREMYHLMNYKDNSRPLKISIGDREKRLFSYLDVHEKATAMEFSKLVNISRRRAERILVKLVRAGVLQIHNDMNTDYYTIVGEK